MGQPTPPGDIPLYEGLGSEWNDIVGAFPEDKRAELAPLLKSRIDQYEPLKQWEDLQRSGITKEHAENALRLYSTIENNPREVYNTIGNYLGITPQQAEQLVEEIQEGDPEEDPRIATMQQQIDTLSQIALANRQNEMQTKQQQEAENAINTELEALKKKYGDVDEEQVILRMLHSDMTAEQAYQAYTQRDALIRRRPAPLLLGSAGNVPKRGIDVTKLDNQETKNVVTQMLQQAAIERNG